jgi:hypothetical protein
MPATNTAAPAPITALDADGEEFALDFADMAVSTARPVAPAVETDKVQARLAHEVVAAGIRHDFHADRGLLPR